MRGDGGVFKPKDRSTWYCFVPAKPVRVKRGPFRTKSEALEAWRALRKEIAAGKYRGPEEEKLRVEDLLTAFRANLVLRGAKSVATFDAHARIVSAALGHMKAVEVTAQTIDRVREAWLAEDRKPRKDGTVSGKRRDASTVDRYLEIVRAAYRLAVKQKRISGDRVPYIALARPDNRRTGFVEEETFWKLFKALNGELEAPAAGAEAPRATAPVRTVEADVALFAYRSGWRRDEVESLTFEQIDKAAAEAWLFDSKNGRRRVLPLVAELAEVVARREAARRYEAPDGTAALSTFVFHRGGRRLGDWRKRWASACKAAGVPGLLFHDFRRSAVRNFVRAGVPQVVAMEITGHVTRSIFDRYNIATTDESRKAILATVEYLTGKPTAADAEEKGRA